MNNEEKETLRKLFWKFCKTFDDYRDFAFSVHTMKDTLGLISNVETQEQSETEGTITLDKNEYEILTDVVSSLKVVSKEYPGILLDLKQEIENADRVIYDHKEKEGEIK